MKENSIFRSILFKKITWKSSFNVTIEEIQNSSIKKTGNFKKLVCLFPSSKQTPKFHLHKIILMFF